MRPIFTLFMITFFVGSLFSQKYMDKIVEESCSCIDDIDLASPNTTMKVGLCMIQSATPYAKELKRDHGIDFDQIETEGEKLGGLIATQMITVCPTKLIEIASLDAESDDDENSVALLNETGTVTKIEQEAFIVFTLKNPQGKVSKFYWLNFPTSNLELASEYEKLLQKEVQIEYRTEEFFDPKLEGYRQHNIISSINTL